MIKLDQNLEERKKLENGINNRLGAALLLLNNTIHEQGDIYDLRSDERKVRSRDKISFTVFFGQKWRISAAYRIDKLYILLEFLGRDD